MATQVQVDPKLARAQRRERNLREEDERDEWLERAWRRANAAKRSSRKD